MGTRIVTFAENEFYHVYNRGTDKRVIFQSPSDYERFTELLYAANNIQSVNIKDIKRTHSSVYEFERSEQLVAIGAYCLMPNHFHILLTPLVPDGISKFMGKLTTGYSMYFNKKYERTGSLFEGRFKAKWCDTDEYLKYLYAYIHLNPVKIYQADWKERGIDNPSKAYQYASSFQYSSLKDYLGVVRPEMDIINPTSFPDYFVDSQNLKQDLFEWLTYNDSE